jgi:type II secretory pathway pseudopilin PulG
VSVAAGLVCGFFAGLYRHLPEPIGFDTSLYLTQATLAAKHGLHGVAHLVIPRPHKLWTSRIGFPVTVLSLSGLFRTSTFAVAAVVPIGAVAAAALACGALVSHGLRRGPVVLAAVTVVVGTSVGMTQMIVGTYEENLLAQAAFAAALVPIATTVTEGRGYLAALLVLGAGGLAHQAIYGSMLAVLVLVGVGLLPGSWRAWRSGRVGVASTPVVRLGAVLGGAGAVTAAGIYGILRVAPYPALLKRQEFAPKVQFIVPLYRLPVTVPIAAIGAAVEGMRVRRLTARRASGPDPGPIHPSTKFFFILMAAWTIVSAVGIAGYYLGRAWPAHRFFAFALPLPIFLALGILAIGEGATRGVGAVAGATLRRAARPLGIAVAIMGLAGAVFMGSWTLYRAEARRGLQTLSREKLQLALTAEAYLRAAGIPPTRPVVFVLDDHGSNPQLTVPGYSNILRAPLPADLIERVYFYVGTPENYLAAVPTLLPEDIRNYNTMSKRFWHDLQPALPHDPVALMLRTTNPAYDAYSAQHPEQEVAPGVISLNGPRAIGAITAAPVPTAPRGLARAGLLAAAVLVVLGLVGLGWGVALLPPTIRPFERLALGPGFGIGMLILAGAAADLVGVRLGGWAGAFTLLGCGLAGWALAGVRLARARRSPQGSSPGPRRPPP